MIKPTKKKLSLATQTLRTLQDDELGAVAGATGIYTACGCTRVTQQVRNSCLLGCTM